MAEKPWLDILAEMLRDEFITTRMMGPVDNFQWAQVASRLIEEAETLPELSPEQRLPEGQVSIDSVLFKAKKLIYSPTTEANT